MLELLRQLVENESPSHDKAAVDGYAILQWVRTGEGTTASRKTRENDHA